MLSRGTSWAPVEGENKVRRVYITFCLTVGLTGGGSAATSVQVFIFAAEWELTAAVVATDFWVTVSRLGTDVVIDGYLDILTIDLWKDPDSEPSQTVWRAEQSDSIGLY